MPNIDKVLGGIGILIFVYLLFNGQQVSQVLNNMTQGSVRLITALQGR